MEIYLYCSYEQSQRGFCLTKIEGNTLVSCPNAPEIIGNFFYYDRYQVLWQDIPADLQPNKQEVAIKGSFFGLRGLKGRIQGGRWGSANIALLTNDPGELSALRRMALGILGDVDQFNVLLLQQLSIGGDAGYLLDVPVLLQYLNAFSQASKLKLLVDGCHPAMALLPSLQRKDTAQTTSELLRLAVGNSLPNGSAEKAKGFFRRKKPRPLLTPEQFKDIFTGQGPLWTLHAAQM